MFDNTEPIFEFYASCDNAVLELDLSNMDHELLIHNSLLNPAQTIYIYLLFFYEVVRIDLLYFVDLL